MPRQEKPVTMVKVDYMCDECGRPMKCLGQLERLCDPPKFSHMCEDMHRINLDRPYPQIEPRE